ncbi:S-layer homology domain-containing protein [Paenibacillus endoradicis]|uniref:S-layer homology domain-containing protein n=1 Tax=Paenibacillus endoradicis TaxID=2972487 RepID=UPI002158CC9F|nr:S-layer homology domain-containing protein [Paenibacillus endoradicis]MCR8660179.1 S-layer homology domain-containing protein [Paenibacillus endoradicis]
MRSSNRFISMFLVAIMSLTLFDTNFVFAEENIPDNNDIVGINYTAVANGEANKTTSNLITLVFEEPVTGLVENDITITADTASATKGTLTLVEGSNDTQYNLAISGVTIEGTVNLKITKEGVDDSEKIVDIHRIPITFNVANVGGTAFLRDSTAIRLTFNTAVANLSEDDIILSNGTPVAVSNYATSSAEKGSLTKVSGTVYELALIDITRTGTLGVQIDSIGIETNKKNVIINAKVDKTALQPTPPRDIFPQNITDLPKSPGLNDLFQFLDPDAGTNGRVETNDDWLERREELKDLIQYYYYGIKYPTPKSAITVNIQTNQVNVTIKDNDRTVTGSLGSITVPSGTAPEGGWPVIIAFGFGQTAMAIQNGYAVISVSNWGGSRTGNYYNLYPFNPYEHDFNTGSIMTAAWTVSRIIDAMEISAEANGGINQWNMNPYKSITTGVSINGKYALMSAAMDDRVGAAAPVDSGQSGVSSFRYTAEGKLFYYDSPIDKIYRRNQKGLNSIQYSGESFWMGLGTASGFHLQTDMDYLPFDAHAVEALMAPRPLIAFAADNNFDWTTPPASVMAMSAAKEVYEFLGSDNIAVRVRDGAHAIQDRDVPFMIAVMDKEFNGKPLEVKNLYPNSNPPSYGTGTYDKISDMMISPYDVDSSYIRWSRPGKYTLWTENEIVSEGSPATIMIHSDDTKVKLTILDTNNKPTEDTWTADVVNGTAVFNLTDKQVKIGRYEITTVGTAKDSKTVYFQGIDLATALRHGTARNDNGAAVMYGFTSKINKDLVEVYADGNRLTQSFQEDTEQAWILNYGVTTNPNENNRILNNTFNVVTLKKLQMDAMPGSTFEISIDKSKLANNQETVSWNASAVAQKIGPQPDWPPYPNSQNDDGTRPLLPVTTTNFSSEITFSLNDLEVLNTGDTLEITFDEPMHKGDFGIGFDFSDDFTLMWAEDNKSVEVTFNNVTIDNGEVGNIYIMRLRDANGNMIAAPIHHSFTLKQTTLAAPTNVSALAKSNSDIEIGWTASEDATGYNVYRSASAEGSYSQVNTELITETKFQDSDLSASTTYYYKVTAVNDAGESELSAVVQATTNSESTNPISLPSSPTNVSTQAKSTSAIEINWTASENATGYNVYRSASADGDYSKVNKQLITETKFHNSGLSASTTYYYKVAAVNGNGESVLSFVAQATTNSVNTGPVTTPTSPTTPAEETLDELKVEVDSSGNAIALVNTGHVKKALSEAKAGTMKLVVLGAENAKQVTVSIPTDQVNVVKEAGIKRIEISFGLASVQLPVSLFEGAADKANVELSIATVDNSTLSEVARVLVGSNTVYDFKLIVDGQRITDFGQGQQVKVEVPYTLKPGESPDQIVIYYLSDDGTLEIIKNSRYNKETGVVEFNAKHFSQYAAMANSVKFSDTKAIVWASDSIDGLAARGIVSGMTKDSFAPSNSVTRAEFIQMLMLTIDLNQDNATSTFSDVKQGEWYYKSVASAQQLGIVSGLTDGSFGVSNKITRQEMAAMAYRAIQKVGITLKVEQEAVTFNDAQDFASYAKEAVTAMHKAGIINGVGNDKFDPEGTATRAQAAVILYRLLMKSL